MGAGEIIAIVISALTVGAAVIYILKAKRRGDKCVGCPYAKECKAKSSADCCSSEKNKR